MPAKPKPELEERLWTPAELAARWGISLLTLRDWRWRRVGPRVIYIARHPRYPESEIAKWEAAQKRTGAVKRTA